MGTPNREPFFSRNIIEYKDPGSYIPMAYICFAGNENVKLRFQVFSLGNGQTEATMLFRAVWGLL